MIKIIRIQMIIVLKTNFFFEVEFIFGNFREIYGKNKALLFRLREAMRQSSFSFFFFFSLSFSHFLFFRWPKQNDFAATFLQLDQLMEPYRFFFSLLLSSLLSLLPTSCLIYLLIFYIYLLIYFALFCSIFFSFLGNTFYIILLLSKN